MNRKLRFILKRTFFLILLVILAVFIIHEIFNFSNIHDKKFVLMAYLGLILPLVLIYVIVILLFKLGFNRFNLRKANKFQFRLMVSFALISFIPILPLAFLTDNLVNKSMEIWLTKSVEESLDAGLNFVSTIHDIRKEKVSLYLNILNKNIIIKNGLNKKMDEKSKALITQLVNQNKIDSLFILNPVNELVFEFQSKKLIKNIFLKNIYNILAKNNIYIENRNVDNSEYLIGYTHIYNSDKDARILGTLIIGEFLPEKFSENANKIAQSLQSYKQMSLYKKPILKGATTFIIIVMTLIVFLVAIIISYFISRNITEPIKILLDGTKRIVAGDLNFEIQYNAKDEVKLLINAFNHMTRELQASKQALTHSQRLAAWRDIARRIAHEIRNPLTPIKLSIERLLLQSNSKNFSVILEKSSKVILEEVNRLELLIKEFSEFAKVPQLHLEVLNLNHIIIDTLNIFSGVDSVSFKTDLEKDLPMLNLDKKRIREVLINLINNGMESMENKKGQISITTFLKTNIFGRFVYLEIQDDGKGISPENLNKIFDPYFTTKKDGTGLGLAIVEKIITEHHAKIKCESEPGKGTKINLEFAV